MHFNKEVSVAGTECDQGEQIRKGTGGGGGGTDCAGTCKQDKELAFMLSEIGGL